MAQACLAGALLALALGGCRPGAVAQEDPPRAAPIEPMRSTGAEPPSVTPPAEEAPSGAPAPPEAPKALTLIAGGDVSFGRDLGQALLKDPKTSFFQHTMPLLRSADIRFVNLESQLSDQKGETQSPWVALVFTGPPSGADALAEAGIQVVSTANNHAWDYGKKALFETLDNLDRAGVKHVGTGRTREDAYAPAIVASKNGRVAFIAVTGMWNQGLLRKHAAAEYVADADPDLVLSAVRAARARADVDFVVLSYHGGVEYIDSPLPKTRTLLQAAVDAGADAVIGHHPHVAQGMEIRNKKPIFYSLGNFVMQMSEGRPKVSGFLARLRFSKQKPTEIEICPLRFPNHVGRPLTDHSGRKVLEKRFFGRLERISKTFGALTLGEPQADGCAPVSAAE